MQSKSIFDENASIYRWIIPQFDEEFRRFSPEFHLRNFPWKFEIRRIKSTSKEDMLNFYLHRTNEERNVELTCIAFASIKIISFDENVEPHRKVISAVEFGSRNTSPIGVPLISLGNLMNANTKYIQNDKIVLEIEMKVDAPQRIHANNFSRLEIVSNEQPTQSKLCLTVNNFDKMIGIMSPTFFLLKTPWQICVYRNDDMLGIYLQPTIEKQFECVYHVNLTIKLLSFDRNQNAHTKNLTGTIDVDGFPFGAKDFIRWDALFDAMTQYVQNGTIKFELEIEVKKVLDTNTQVAFVSMECPICMESLIDRPVITLKCGHMFCQDCIDSGIKTRKKCAICNKKAINTQHRRIYLPRYFCLLYLFDSFHLVHLVFVTLTNFDRYSFYFQLNPTIENMEPMNVRH